MMHKSDQDPIDGRNTPAKCFAVPHIALPRGWKFPLALVLLLPGPALAAGFTCAPPASINAPPPSPSQLTQLDEVTVTPGKSTTRTRDLGAWLKRLEGQYSYEGYVDLCGNGNAADQRPVTGKADCVAIYNAHSGRDSSINSTDPPPDVMPIGLYCAVDVRWPPVRGENGVPVMGGDSSLSPAAVIYGVVPSLPGIQFMQIDNKGITTQTQGKLAGDTLTTRESCSLPGYCQKVTRITTRADSPDIAMLIDTEIDSRRVHRQAFLLHRVSNIYTARSDMNLRKVGER